VQIPTKKECFALMCEMKMMDHIVTHSLQVCRVATFLADRLNGHEIYLNHDLIRAAALLHDITKTRSFETSENHALTGGQFLSDLGYPEVADLVRQHVRLDEYETTASIREVEIINYADKRVLHDEIVGLDRRLDYILERYATTREHKDRIYHLWIKTRDLEERIFSSLQFAPEDIYGLIQTQALSIEFQEFKHVCAHLS